MLLPGARVVYLALLRLRDRRTGVHRVLDAEHASAKATLLRMRIEEKQGKLVLREDVNELIDGMAGMCRHSEPDAASQTACATSSSSFQVRIAQLLTC